MHPTGAELFHAHGRTDGHDVAKSRFSQFCQRAKKREKNYNRNQ